MTRESFILVEKCKILVYRYVGSIGIEFSWEDLPADLQVSIARGKDPPPIVTSIELANFRVDLDSYVRWV